MTAQTSHRQPSARPVPSRTKPIHHDDRGRGAAADPQTRPPATATPSLPDDPHVQTLPKQPTGRDHQEGRARVQRIEIVGAGGAGKTVLARRLGKLLDLPVTHVDALRYRPNWDSVPGRDLTVAQDDVVAGPAWILDGNNLATLHLRAAAAARISTSPPDGDPRRNRLHEPRPPAAHSPHRREPMPPILAARCGRER